MTEQENNTIVVTGGAGYIGSHVVRLLLDNGFDVVVIDDLSSGKQANLPPGFTPGVNFFNGDFADGKIWQQIYAQGGAEAVVHLAASIDANESLSEREKYIENNFTKTQQLLDILQDLGRLGSGSAALPVNQPQPVKQLIFASTAAVYGATGSEPVMETAFLKPMNPYGESKVMAEQAINQATQFKTVCLRFFNVAGTIDTIGVLPQNPHGLISQISAAAKDGQKEFLIYGDDYPTPDGTCIRDFVNPQDIARAILACVQQSGTLPQNAIFNVGTGHGYSVLQILNKAREVAGKPILSRVAARRDQEVPISICDNSLIKRTLNFELQNSDLDTILRTSL
ncbi:UDP-glucose 4-epimerase GalE [bacterium]|nr:MAG: UDP-glucose 4-epimerase GalE [bacterium]